MAFKSTADSTDIKALMTSTSPSTRLLPKSESTLYLDIEKYSVNPNAKSYIHPVIVADNLSGHLALDPNRDRRLEPVVPLYLRDGELEDPLTPIYRAGKKNAHAVYTRDVPFASWMEQSTVETRAESANCCDDAPERLTGPSP